MPRLSAASIEAGKTAVRASEVPMLLGISPYGGPTALWLRKIEGQEPAAAESLAQRLGQLLEGPTRELVGEREGVRIRPNVETRRHRTVPLVATPDGLVRYPAALYEGKASAWVRDWGEPGDPDGVPPAVRAQVAAQLAVWRKRRVLVGALIGGRDPRAFWLERDRELVDAIEQAVIEFWPYVERREPPPVDGSDDAAAWLRRRFAAAPGAELVATAEQAQLVEELRAAALGLFAAQDRYELVRQQVCELLIQAGAERLLSPAGALTWKPTHPVDWEALARELDPPADLVAAHTTTNWKAVAETLRPRATLVDAHRLAEGPPRFTHPWSRRTQAGERSAA